MSAARHSWTRCLATSLAVLVLMAAGLAEATEYTWTGGAADGGLWTTPANWSVGEGYPSTADDTALFAANTEAEVCFDQDVAFGTLIVTNKNMNLVFTADAGVSVSVGTLNLGADRSTAGGRTKVTFSGCSLTSSGSIAFNPGAFVLLTNKTTLQTAGCSMIMSDGSPYAREARLEVRGGSTFISTGDTTVTGTSVLLIEDSVFDCRGSFYIDNALKYQAGGWGRVVFEGTSPLLKVAGKNFCSNGRDGYYPSGGDFLFKMPATGYVCVPVQYTGTGTFMKKSNSSPYTFTTRFTVTPDSPVLFSTAALEQTLVSLANPMTSESLVAEKALDAETLDAVSKSEDGLSLVYRRAAAAGVLTVTGTPFEIPGPDYSIRTGISEGDECTLTAPAHPEGADYVTCTGYNLYDVDAATHARTLVSGSPFSGTTCTYVHGTGRRELEWIWSVPQIDVTPQSTALESGAALQAVLDRYAYAKVNVACGTYDLPAGSAFLVTNAIDLVGGADDPYSTQLRVATVTPRGYAVEISNRLARLSRVLMTNQKSNNTKSIGAARLWSGLVDHCIVSNCDNGVSGGINIPGAICLDSGTIRDTLVCDCRHDRYGGGGIGMSGGLVERCRVTRCYSEGYAGSAGGGICASGGTIRNTLVDHCRGMNPGGTGIYAKGLATVENCTVVDNSSLKYTYTDATGLYATGNRAIVRNTIVWKNTDMNGVVCDVGQSGFVTFEDCDSTSDLDEDCGNFCANPAFGDSYGIGFSACVNGAKKLWWMPSATDLSGESRIKGTGPDLGALERDASSKLMCSFTYTYHDGVDSATIDVKALVDGAGGAEVYTWSVLDARGNVVETISGHDYATHTFNLSAGLFSVRLRVEEGANSDETTQTGIARVRASTVYLNESGAEIPPYSSRENGCRDFETALALVADGGRLMVAPGTYLISNAVEFSSLGVDICSLEGPAVTTLKSTPGGNIVSATRPTFLLANGNARLRGVTVTTSVGANRGLVKMTDVGAVVSNCVIRNASGHYYNVGIGVNMTAGTVLDTTICNIAGDSAASAQTSGSGLYMTGGLFDRCVVSNCYHSGNVKETKGGAVYVSGGAVRNSLFCGNYHKMTYPIYICGTATFDNCTLSRNYSQNALDSGRELAAVRIGETASARNCLFTGNYNTYAGITNVIFDATATVQSNFVGENMRFKKNGGLRLMPTSSAVNAGTLLDWMTDGATDLDGTPRVKNRVPDIGCYECERRGTLLLVR